MSSVVWDSVSKERQCILIEDAALECEVYLFHWLLNWPQTKWSTKLVYETEFGLWSGLLQFFERLPEISNTVTPDCIYSDKYFVFLNLSVSLRQQNLKMSLGWCKKLLRPSRYPFASSINDEILQANMTKITVRGKEIVLIKILPIILQIWDPKSNTDF